MTSHFEIGWVVATMGKVEWGGGRVGGGGTGAGLPGAPWPQRSDDKGSAPNHICRAPATPASCAVYEGLLSANKVPDLYSSALSLEQEKRRVVLKKANLDNSGIRTNFLKAGGRRGDPPQGFPLCPLARQRWSARCALPPKPSQAPWPGGQARPGRWRAT